MPSKEDRVNDEPNSRSCGCSLDYHLADCPIRTSNLDDFEQWYFDYHNDQEWDWYTRSLNGDY